MKVTLELDDPADVVADLRERGSYSTDLLAEQIEAQLPKPLPPEPTGDVIARTASGWYFTPSDGQWMRDDKREWLRWSSVVGTHGPIAVYRPVPSPEAVEAEVTAQANHAHYYSDEWDMDAWVRHHREFARRLLDGAK